MMVRILNSQPQTVKNAFLNPQNFYKHGHYGERGHKKDQVMQVPDYTEMVMADNISTCWRLFKTTSPLLDLFILRFSMEFPGSKVSLENIEVKFVERGYDMKMLASVSRIGFLKIVLPLLVEFSAADREAFQQRLHSNSPPESEKP